MPPPGKGRCAPTHLANPLQQTETDKDDDDDDGDDADADDSDADADAGGYRWDYLSRAMEFSIYLTPWSRAVLCPPGHCRMDLPQLTPSSHRFIARPVVARNHLPTSLSHVGLRNNRGGRRPLVCFLDRKARHSSIDWMAMASWPVGPETCRMS